MTNIQRIQRITIKVLNNTATFEEKRELQYYLETTGQWDMATILFPEAYAINTSAFLQKHEKQDMLRAIKRSKEYVAIKLPQKSSGIIDRNMFYAAACFLIILLSGIIAVFMFRSSDAEITYASITTPYGQQRKILLADGTEVFMNAGSSLKYPIRYSDRIREVFLEGEAFFEVTKDSRRPFVIHAGGMLTKVLGTSFNIRAYAEEATRRVQVKTGKVSVTLDGAVKNGETREVILTPEEELKFTPGERKGFTEQKVGNDDIASWIGHKLIFNDQPLSEILRELERVYNVNFRILSPEVASLRYTIRLDQMPLRQTIETIQLLTNLEFEDHTTFITVHSKKAI